MEEQQVEVQRQAQLQQLAAAADERWASKKSFLDGPDTRQIGPGLRPRDEGGYGMESVGDAETGARGGEGESGVTSVIEGDAPLRRRGATAETESKRDDNSNPWKQFEQRQGTPGEAWQPEAWSPGKTAKPAPRGR